LADDPKAIPDPDHVPVRHVTGVVSNIFNGHFIAMNLVTDRMAVGTDGSTQTDLIIAARLRFDLNVAKNIRDQIDAHLSGLTNAQGPDTKPN
jgi:hypothetical protein